MWGEALVVAILIVLFTGLFGTFSYKAGLKAGKKQGFKTYIKENKHKYPNYYENT